MAGNETIRIAIAEPSELIRFSIVKALHEFDAIEAANGKEMLEKLSQEKELPDICILALDMPKMGGYALMDKIRKTWPEIHLMVLTILDNKFNVLYALQKGAQAYILSNCSIKTLKEAVNSVVTKGFYYSEQAPKQLFEQVRNGIPKPIKFNEREIEFIRYAHTNLELIEIAAKMSVNKRTIDGIRDRLFQKLNINSRETLVLLALKTAIADDDEKFDN